MFKNILLAIIMAVPFGFSAEAQVVTPDILEASLWGRLEVVRLLLDKGVDVNTKDKDGSTALMKAAGTGHLEVVNLLIGKGSDVNAKDNNSSTALMSACWRGHLEVVKVLLSAGADVNLKTDKTANTALMMASKEGYPEVVKVLLDAGADVDSRSDRYKETALMMASDGGFFEREEDLPPKKKRDKISTNYPQVVKILLDKGANVNAKDRDGQTALMMAAFKGRLEVVKLLLDKGAEVDAKDKDGETALATAVYIEKRGPGITDKTKKNKFEVAKLLIDKGANVDVRDREGNSVFEKTEELRKDDEKRTSDKLRKDDEKKRAEESRREALLNVIKRSIDERDDINSRGSNGRTLLMDACYRNDIEEVKILLDMGADINRVGRRGETALVLACEKCNWDCDFKLVNLLLEKGADVNLKKDSQSRTPLMAASGSGKPELVQLLIDKGACRDAKDCGTALILAISPESIDKVKLLLDAGADANVRSESGDPALVIAIENQVAGADKDWKKILVKLLLDKGADANTRDRYGRTVLMRAIQRNETEVVKILLDRGADVNAVDKDGKTALKVAHNAEMVKLLLDTGANVDDKTETQLGGISSGALISAIKNGDPEAVRLLLDKGADVNTKDEWDATALRVAVRRPKPAEHMQDSRKQDSANSKTLRDYFEIINLLLDRGADVNAITRFKVDPVTVNPMAEGSTALIDAVCSGTNDYPGCCPKVVKLLLDKGADVNARGKSRYAITALMAAFRVKDSHDDGIEVIELLLDRGADVNVRDQWGGTLFMRTAYEKVFRNGNQQVPNYEMMRLLLDKGADINAKNNYGETALMKAYEHSNLDVAKFLMDNGATVDAKNNKGRKRGKTPY